MMVRLLTLGLLLLTMDANAQSPVVESNESKEAQETETSASAKSASMDSKVAVVEGVDDALHEVNAQRAKRGLRPFLPDPGLNLAARRCAKIRAANFIKAHLSNDFAQLPEGTVATAAGCGALDPSWGWQTCCTYDGYTYAGAAWVMGKDGRRYMHLFVR